MKAMALTAAAFLMLATAPCLAKTLHVKDAATAAEGTAGQPTGLHDALARATADPQITEIILAGGEYGGHFKLRKPRDVDPATLPLLTIRPAEGAIVLIRHAVRIDNVEPVEGKPGLFTSSTLPVKVAHMWERDTRIRYQSLTTKDSVAAYPASCFADHESKTLYLSTSDGRPPGEHEVWLSLTTDNNRALFVERDNVVIQGLRFADYISANVLAIQSSASNLTIRDCHFDNCHKGWAPGEGSRNIVMENCTGRDVAQPVISFGDGVVIRNCRFEKSRDRFLYSLFPQNDCGYQVYHPGRGGTIEGNFAKGYYNGIVIKAGRSLPYSIRHNTIVDSHTGVLWSHAGHNGQTLYNVIVGARSFIQARRYADTFRVDHNLFWQPEELGQFAADMQAMRGGNLGKFNMLADPRFVDAPRGDYRLLPDSPALALKDESGRHAGAFAAVDATTAAAQGAAPTLTLAFQADSRPFGPTGDYTFDRDPWIGGGTTHVRELQEEGVARRLTGRDHIIIEPRAFDASGAVTVMRLSVGDGIPQEVPYDDVHQRALPADDGDYRIRCEVRNDRGVWSTPAEAMVRVDRSVPSLDGSPTVLSNSQGVIIAFTTTEPCIASLRYGRSADAMEGRVASKPLVKRSWNSNDGGEWIETWSVPRREHALAVLAPDISPGQTIYCKLTLTDQGNLSSESDVFEATAAGEPRITRVGLDGEDRLKAGKYRSLQFAVDRALPGDRIVMESGVYTDYTCITHGGTDETHRVTIESATESPSAAHSSAPLRTTLDGAKRHTAMIHLENAPWVTIRGLRILNFQKAGIYAYRSPHTEIDRCTFYNGEGWTTGYHTFMFWSPDSRITGCLAVGAEVGFYFLQSPAAAVLHNTASQHMFAAANYTYSARDTVQMYNSFAFAGNDIYSIHGGHPDESRTFRSDYNNLGSIVSAFDPTLKSRDPALFAKIQEQEFKPIYQQPLRTVSKAIVNVDGTRYQSFEQWRQASGQDQHSIFADPQYRRPWPPIDNWDWSVQPGSPNQSVTDSLGVPIGAGNFD